MSGGTGRTSARAAMVRTAGRRGAAGFTLLELLVAMLLLGLLSGLLYGGLRFGARAWEKSHEELARLEDWHAAHALIRRQLTRAVPYPSPAVGGEPRVAFAGDGDALTFVSVAPAQSLTGGLYRQRIEVDTDGERSHLMLRLALLDPESAAGGATAGRVRRDAEARAVVILSDVEAVSFAYFGSDRPNLPPRWTEMWTDAQGLPILIRVDVAWPSGDRRIWPLLVVRPMLTLPPP